jgi:hypothetical protein
MWLRGFKKTRKVQIFQISSCHPKILGARKTTRCEFQTEDTQILDATVHNLETRTPEEGLKTMRWAAQNITKRQRSNLYCHNGEIWEATVRENYGNINKQRAKQKMRKHNIKQG